MFITAYHGEGIKYYGIVDGVLTELTETEFSAKLEEEKKTALKAQAYDIVTGVSE